MPGHSEIRLHQIYPNPDVPDIETDIDIIAVHGLDTRSPETWEFKNVKENKVLCNWLLDKEMLPKEVGKARIFTIDWPAEMFEGRLMTPRSPLEVAGLLVAGIKQRLKPGEFDRDRPVYFIASCLGGIMLIKALLIDEGKQILQYTRGFTFLATPFSGTALVERDRIARRALSLQASKKRRNVTQLYNAFLGKLNEGRGELENQFLRLQAQYKFHIVTFYEKECTSLSGKVGPKFLSKVFPVNVIVRLFY